MILCKFQRWEFITEKLWSKFPLLADKVEEAADYNKDYGKYDIYIISRISQFTSVYLISILISTEC